MARSYRQSLTPIQLRVPWDMTDVEAEIAFAPDFGVEPTVVKSTTDGSLVFEGTVLENGKTVSLLRCTLTEEETANWNGEVKFTVRANEDQKGWQVLGNGSFHVFNTVLRKGD